VIRKHEWSRLWRPSLRSSAVDVAAPSHTATAFVAASSVAAPPFIAQVTDNVILPENKKYENTSELIISANVRAIESSRSLCCSVCSKMDHSVLNNADIATAAADCNAPDRSVSYYIVSHEKLCPPRCSFFFKILWSLFISKRTSQFQLCERKISVTFQSEKRDSSWGLGQNLPEVGNFLQIKQQWRSLP